VNQGAIVALQTTVPSRRKLQLALHGYLVETFAEKNGSTIFPYRFSGETRWSRDRFVWKITTEIAA